MDWLIYGGAIVLFLALQTGLNALFHLGKPVDANLLAAQLGVNMTGNALLIIAVAVQMVVVGLAAGAGDRLRRGIWLARFPAGTADPPG